MGFAQLLEQEVLVGRARGLVIGSSLIFRGVQEKQLEGHHCREQPGSQEIIIAAAGRTSPARAPGLTWQVISLWAELFAQHTVPGAVAILS